LPHGHTLFAVQPLLIADVPWLLYRAFFSLPKSIADARGHPVNALLGTVNALLAAIEGCRPRAVAACLGAEQAEYRVALYPPYHAHRDPMPAELAWQWKRAPDLLESLAWTVTETQTLEADDLMLSYARTEEEAGGRALLLTADRDLFGAVSDRVSVLEMRKGAISDEIGPAQVRERYGVEAALVPDFIALRGDPSDGLPGASGVGPKKAAELLVRHGSLQGVLAAAARPGTVVAGEMTPRLAATLRESADQLRDFKEIATLQRVEVKRPRDSATDFAAGAHAARRLGMKRLAARLEEMAAATA
jgi:DNA polymerase-1